MEFWSKQTARLERQTLNENTKSKEGATKQTKKKSYKMHFPFNLNEKKVRREKHPKNLRTLLVASQSKNDVTTFF